MEGALPSSGSITPGASTAKSEPLPDHPSGLSSRSSWGLGKLFARKIQHASPPHLDAQPAALEAVVVAEGEETSDEQQPVAGAEAPSAGAAPTEAEAPADERAAAEKAAANLLQCQAMCRLMCPRRRNGPPLGPSSMGDAPAGGAEVQRQPPQSLLPAGDDGARGAGEVPADLV